MNLARPLKAGIRSGVISASRSDAMTKDLVRFQSSLRDGLYSSLLLRPKGAMAYLSTRDHLSVRSTRQHKAWGGAQRNPRNTEQLRTMSPRSGRQTSEFKTDNFGSAVARSAGSQFFVRFNPGADAPGFMLPSASRTCKTAIGGVLSPSLKCFGILKYISALERPA